MEPCSKDEMRNMDTSGELFAPHFYIHLPVIYELRVLISFTSFETGFLTDANVTPSQGLRMYGIYLELFTQSTVVLVYPPCQSISSFL